ncbi:hypothetical protein ACFWXK_34885 [Streptomyces sp. NPDC059070]|uniref:hypothetical protein n=1 Tax=unclassified Streptomyces TaxID=2593676 RepID=UPI0034E27C30
MGDGDTGGSQPDRLAHLLGGLLIELGEKVRRAGIDGVRILTDDELQCEQLRWFREGWEEAEVSRRAAARATAPEEDPAPYGTAPDRYGDESRGRAAAGHPDDDRPLAPGRLLQFPHAPDGRGGHPLPIVGTGQTRGKDLMPHRPRGRPRPRPADPGDDPDPPGSHPHV